MSTLPNSKGKDAGKKAYTSLNVNQTYKGSKGENKSTAGQTTRQHGLQSLGKVQSRRAPVPANLPSLKRENLGNDPRIHIVPSGSQGWVKQDSTVQSGKQENRIVPSQSKLKPDDGKEISLRPNASVAPQVKVTTDGAENQGNGKSTWISKTIPQPSGPPTYFAKEFPKLGGKEGEGGLEKAKDQQQGNAQGASHPEMDHHQPYVNGQKWMDKHSGPMPVPSNFQMYHGDRPMYDGNQQSYPFPYPLMYPPGQSGRGMPMPPYPYFPYPPPAPGGKMPFDPRFFGRMPKPLYGGPSTSHTDRPSVVKDSDLKSLEESERDDAGWAGVQEEVDYNAKLKFDESDESDDDGGDKNQGIYEIEDKARKSQEAWQEYLQSNFPSHMQMAYNPQNWHRMPQISGYDPSRVPTPAHAFPMHPMYYIPFGYPQNVPPLVQGKSDDSIKETENTSNKVKPLHPDDKREMERKAAAQAKLKELEEKMKRRTAEEQQQLEDAERSRADNEASDSSRREIPPRFRRESSGQQSKTQPSVPSTVTTSMEKEKTSVESSQLKLMQRKGSFVSEEIATKADEVLQSSEATEQKVTIHQTEKPIPNLPNNSKNERMKNTFEEKSSSHVSTNNKDRDKSESGSKRPVQIESKDLPERMIKELNASTIILDNEASNKGNKTGDSEDKAAIYSEGKPLTVNSQRFQELKLTKGHKKHDKSQDKKDDKSVAAKKDTMERKPQSPWSQVVSGEKHQLTEENQSFQKEEEKEQEEKKKQSNESAVNTADVSEPHTNVVDRLSPTENKFRSDFYDKKGNQRYSHEDSKSKSERRGRFVDDSHYKNRSERNAGYKKDDYYNRNEKRDNRTKVENRNYRRDETDARRFKEDGHKDRYNYREDRSNYKKGDSQSKVKENESKPIEEIKLDSKANKDDSGGFDSEVPEISTERKDYKAEKSNVSNKASSAEIDRKRNEKKEGLKKDKTADKRIEETWREDGKYERREDRRGDYKDYYRRDSQRDNYGKHRLYDREGSRSFDRKREEKQYSKYADKRDHYSDRKESYRLEKGNRKYAESWDDEKQEYGSKRREYWQQEDYQREPKEKDKTRKDNIKEESTKVGSDTVQPVLESKVSVAKPTQVDKESAKEKQIEGEEIIVQANISKDLPNMIEHEENVKSNDSAKFISSKEYKSSDSNDNFQAGKVRNSTRGRWRGQGGRGFGRGGRSSDYRSKNVVFDDVSSDKFSDDDNEHLSRAKPIVHKDNKIAWENEKAPRFQDRSGTQEYGSRIRRGRRDSDRGRSYGRHVSQVSSNKLDSTPREKNKEQEHRDEYEDTSESVRSDENEGEEERNTDSRHMRGRARGHSSRDSSGRGRIAVINNKPPFLAKRQQVEKRTSAEKKEASSAAESFSAKRNEVQSRIDVKTSEGEVPVQSHQNKTKSSGKKEEKKRDISREYDINNLKSVVCIDDLDIGFDQKSSNSEEDGFVTVTSKKQQKIHQKEMRDRQREEDRKKLLLEQKKEKDMAAALNKCVNNAKKEQKHTAVNSNNLKPVSFVDASMSSDLPEQTAAVAISATVTIPTNQASTSNAAMAAVGAWEPAQMLSGDAAKHMATGTTSSVNAWQRPLSLSASVDSNIPDPRAVGTGKPSSSHLGVIGKSTLHSTQPTPEAASPPVTPPLLGPIGTSTLTNVSVGIPADFEMPEKSDEKNVEFSKKKDHPIEKKVEHRKGDDKKDQKRPDRSERTERPERSARDGKRDKLINKLIMREKPPRFQATKRDSEQRFKSYDDNRRTSSGRQSSSDKTRRRSTDPQRKTEAGKLSQEVKRVSSKPVETIHRDDEDCVFTNDVPKQPVQVARKSRLSDAEKVVGSNKPLKSQTSVGSYNGDMVQEENIAPVTMPESYKKLIVNQISSEEEERKAKDTARSIIKSLNDDEERSLETRSLPGTPPLAVKIPEPPSMSGPSSDPGRGPSPSVTKVLYAQEVNDLSRRMLSAKRAWDDHPRSWPDANIVTSTITVTTPSSIVQSKVEKPSISSSPAKTEAIILNSATTKKSEEKVVPSVSSFGPKRTEQQVCKVKPQQQIHQDEVSDYQITEHLSSSQPTRDMSTSKYTSYVYLDRQLHQNTLYASETNYPGQFRPQASTGLNFQNLSGQVRSVDASVSPLSHHQDLILPSFSVGYGAAPLQGSQNQLVAWEMVSNATAQPSKPITTYETQSQASLFTSSGSMVNSQLIMQYGSNFSPQRNTLNMQRHPVSVMPVQQQQTPVGMIQPTGQSHVQRSHRYHDLSDSGHVGNPNQMTMLIDPNTVGNMQQQMSQQQRSDLMKHVHAKPFEPVSQTPPLVQSPSIVASQHMHRNQHLPSQQPALVPSVFNQPSSVSRPHYVENLTRYSQTMMQHQTAVQPVQPIQQNPLVASVRPQSSQNRMISNVNPISNLERVSTFDPAMTLLSAPMKNQPINVHMHMAQLQRNKQYNHVGFQQKYQNNPLSINGSTRVCPGPIQRPGVQSHSPGLIIETLKVNSVSSSTSRPSITNSESDFKKIQRQKMLEDTKQYFAQDSKQPSGYVAKEEKFPETTLVTNPELAKHDKYILPDSSSKDKNYDRKSKNNRNWYRQRNGKSKSNITNKQNNNKQKNTSKV